jgi:hypothetical protein
MTLSRKKNTSLTQRPDPPPSSELLPGLSSAASLGGAAAAALLRLRRSAALASLDMSPVEEKGEMSNKDKGVASTSSMGKGEE